MGRGRGYRLQSLRGEAYTDTILGSLKRFPCTEIQMHMRPELQLITWMSRRWPYLLSQPEVWHAGWVGVGGLLPACRKDHGVREESFRLCHVTTHCVVWVEAAHVPTARLTEEIIITIRTVGINKCPSCSHNSRLI